MINGKRVVVALSVNKPGTGWGLHTGRILRRSATLR
jgi:hypothetical protein